MVNKGKYFYSLFYLIILFAVTGCSSGIVIKASTDQSVEVQFAMNMEKVLADTVLSISSSQNGSNKKNAHVIFSKEALEQLRKSFDSSDFNNVKVATPTKTSFSISGNIEPPHLQKNVTANNLKASSFVSCTPKSLTVTLSPVTAKKLINTLPEKSREYIDLFMAPIFTGENMTTDEYKSLLAAVYGQELANELEKSFVKIALYPPKGFSIKKAFAFNKEYKTSDSNKIVFSIPLLEFLTLKTKVEYSIKWE